MFLSDFWVLAKVDTYSERVRNYRSVCKGHDKLGLQGQLPLDLILCMLVKAGIIAAYPLCLRLSCENCDICPLSVSIQRRE